MKDYTPDPVAVELAAILKGKRARHGLLQADLADAAGVTQSHWSKMERARAPITIDQLARICERLGESLLSVLDEAQESASQHPRP